MLQASRNWNHWELSVSYLELPEDTDAKDEEETWRLQHARMETRYFVNGCSRHSEKSLTK